jgi:hypothetical protein
MTKLKHNWTYSAGAAQLNCMIDGYELPASYSVIERAGEISCQVVTEVGAFDFNKRFRSVLRAALEPAAQSTRQEHGSRFDETATTNQRRQSWTINMPA